MQKEQENKMALLTRKAIEFVAIKKANSNCLGLMYEPKRPEKIVKR